MQMDVAALISWSATAFGGLYLLGVWLAHGGIHQQDHHQGHNGGSHLPSPLIFGHMAMAALGLLIWAVYVATDNRVLAWSAIGVLAPVVLMGFTMLVTWIPTRRARPVPSEDPPAERHFPLVVVLLHGLLAVLTLTLVVLSTLEVGT
ncbi:hypothetical protein [Streptomyces boninensis]|uniref:hypothetical protein n=1 Tax=Streptomyces boninensis TaxID=2039455 RepID=UPI003B20F0E1